MWRFSGSLGRAIVAGVGDKRDKGSIVFFSYFVGELNCMCVCVCVRAHSIRFSMWAQVLDSTPGEFGRIEIGLSAG